jgi:hypothetical protein
MGKKHFFIDKVGKWREFENGSVTSEYSGDILPRDPNFFEKLYSKTAKEILWFKYQSH